MIPDRGGRTNQTAEGIDPESEPALGRGELGPIRQQLVVGKVTGNTLSGTEEKKPEGDVSFTKKTEPVINEMQKRHLQVIQAMEQELNEDQLHTLMRINDTLITDKTKIPDVADLLDLNKE